MDGVFVVLPLFCVSRAEDSASLSCLAQETMKTNCKPVCNVIVGRLLGCRQKVFAVWGQRAQVTHLIGMGAPTSLAISVGIL